MDTAPDDTDNPLPRPRGPSCGQCGRPAVTRRGPPECLECLRRRIRHDNPGAEVPEGKAPPRKRWRPPAGDPWGENGVRALEDAAGALE